MDKNEQGQARTLERRKSGIGEENPVKMARPLEWLTHPASKEVVVLRATLLKAIRAHFEAEGFLEVDTPTLVEFPAAVRMKEEATAESDYITAPPVMLNSGPFETWLRGEEPKKIYLSTSPEAYLKRYIVGGFSKVFTICSAFRNDVIDGQHSPEFRMIEWEEVGSDHCDQMDRVEVLMGSVVERCLGTKILQFDTQRIDFGKSWKRITLLDSLREIAGISADKMDAKKLRSIAEEHNIHNSDGMGWGLCAISLFEKLVQPKLIEPTFITEHPRDICPLAMPLERDPRLSKRFEPYVAGMELGNSYENQTEPTLVVQQHLENAVWAGARVDEVEVDPGLVSAIELGLKRSAGTALGIDRLIMLLTDKRRIQQVIPFHFGV